MSTRAIVRGAALALVLATTGAALGAQERGGERMSTPARTTDYDENGQSRRLPSLPSGMTLATIRQGDSLFRSAGGCQTCHGQDAQGMPAMGSSLTAGLNFIPGEWGAIDSLITAGIPEPVTRTPIAMPPRGAQSNLTREQTRSIAAYVWAISRVQDEPWPGGHRTHASQPAARQGAAGDTAP
jgi:cytochrome c5